MDTKAKMIEMLELSNSLSSSYFFFSSSYYKMTQQTIINTLYVFIYAFI